MSARIAVLGAGAWGSALAVQAARAGCEVTLWTRNRQARLEDGSLPRLPGVAIPDCVRVSDVMPTDADAVLLTVPMQHLRAVAGLLSVRAPLIACCKGMERRTHRLPLEVLASLHRALPLAVLSGPNFASELARGLPAAAVIASENAELAAWLARTLASQSLRLYSGDDPVGVQVGGAAKNVIAIAAGAAIGGGLGENARAALITRGLAELSRLIVALGGRAATASGLSGLGDLVLTCTSMVSRNTSLGAALGRGGRLPAILAECEGVAEGVETAPALAARAASLGVAVPVIETVSLLLGGTIDFPQACRHLLGRPLAREA